MRYVNQVVLVTGASTGIGKACADHLQDLGHRVYGASRKVKEVQAPRFAALTMDVTDEYAVRAGIDRIVREQGRIDVAINNAGWGLAGAVEDTTIEEAKGLFETNFFGVHRVCRAVLPVMRRQRAGLIINVSSLAGLVGIPFQAFYSASKYALEGLTEALRIEVRPFGIRVAQIEPGDFRTDFGGNRRKTGVSQTESAYARHFADALAAMEAAESRGPTPERIAHLAHRIMQDPRPRLRYSVGPVFQRFGVWMKKWLPAGLFEAIIMKTYHLT
jgi:NAD(P)-dependent dehydrogenase (short-subunit alcohol dehydrogenase family)